MDRLEGLDIVQDISPALEATEDFIQCLEGISDQSHDIHSLRQTQQLYDVKLSNRGVWSQPEVGPLSFAWADHQPPSAISILGQSMGLKHAKKSRAHSTNDLAAHSKDFSSNISNSVFRKGHSRSRSDVNYRSSAFTDNGLHTVDFSTPKNMGLNAKRGAHKETRSAIVVKQAAMQQREGPWRRWAPCHLELTPCELRLYTLDSSANHQLGIAYSLSHCKSVISPAPTIQLCQGDQPQSSDPCTLQAVFFNSTLLELRADSQSEAIEWKRLMWEKVLATRPPKQKQVMTTSCEKNTSVAKFHKATWSSSEVYPRSDHDNDDTIQAGISPSIMNRPTALPLFTQHSQDILKVGLLHLLTEQNKWRAFTFVLTQSVLQAFLTEGCGPVSQPVFWYHLTTCLGVQHDQDPENVDPKNRSQTDPDIFFKTIFSKEVLLLRAESRLKAQSWVEILRKAVELQKPSQTDDDTPRLKGVLLRSRVSQERRRRDDQQEKRQSVTTSFLSILACLAVEKGLTAQNFKCAGCLHQMGLSRGKAKVCCYSGWYYCTSCHQDNTFIIPARLLHNWDTGKHKVSKQAKEFLEFVYEEPLLDVQQLNPCLYGHCEPLSVVLHLRQQLQSLRAYLFSCRAAVAEDLRRRIFPREYLLQHIHLYSIADLQQVIDGKLAPFLSKVIKFASSHVFSCSQCREKGFICELCKNGKVIYPFQESGTKRCKGCGAVFHAECHQKAQPCPRCVRRELNTRPSSFWCNEDDDDVPGCYQDP